MSDSLERRVQFYKVEPDDGVAWKRATVLRELASLTGEDRLLSLGDDQYAWVAVDRIPRTGETGRLRFFRDRRANLPGFAHQFEPGELPIPADAGLIEPMHMVLDKGGLIAAAYNHFAPRVHTHFAQLLRSRLDLDVSIGTYVRREVFEQLERLDDIRLLEASIAPAPGLAEELRNAGSFGEAAAALAETAGNKRVYLRLSAERDAQRFTKRARRFVKAMFRANGAGHGVKVLRVIGRDPLTGGDETVDLLKDKLVRRVDFPKSTQRSKVLDTTAAYSHIEEAVREVRDTELGAAALIFT